MTMQPVETGIPLLTEIILATDAQDEPPELRDALVALPFLPLPPAPVPTALLDDDAIERITQELHTTVLRNLLGQVDLMLEQRIQASLAAVLKTAVDGLACQLRHGLKETLEQVVAQAITQEMAKLPLFKNKNTSV